MNKKPKTEFSKKISVAVISLYLLVILFTMALLWRIETTDGLMYLITSIGGLAMTTIGFYFWKAKMENIIKLSKDNNMAMNDVKKAERDMSDFDVPIEGGGV